MEFCRVYNTEKGLMAAEQEEDKRVELGGRYLVQIGRESLRKILDTKKCIYHVGDVRRFWKVEYVLDICAFCQHQYCFVTRMIKQHAKRI